MTVEVVANPGEGEREAILRILSAHNDAAVGSTERRQVAIVVREETGTITGGLWGKIGYRWLFVEFLAVSPERKRQGIGRDLMQRAEALAREAGCIGIWLDTFSFQARGFYEKLGFAHFGTIDDFPPGHSRFFLSKRID
ncbi:GNAT family N-acetyltransferase [Sphingomonas sp. Leaf10]|uniref:GNAT family N-acetyltransferase n=1 Tax=Sphingomonas sp. Leaf10 TaxID=1735676 RepID=UPI0006F9F96C|nr:GNAT family N-acetyltransferase [Sphingomonas sp. Leaf10]KQM33140.1 GCN5 family acetyltransferase [Sphingomonas sp. Leaf10]